MYVRVAVDVPVDKTFDYSVPPDLEGVVQVGQLVQVGFGTVVQVGIIVALEGDAHPTGRSLKPILELLDAQPVVTPAQIDLAVWMARAYLAPLGACLWLWLPPGLVGRSDMQVRLLEAAERLIVSDAAQRALLDLLRQRGTMRGSALASALSGKNWRAALDALVQARAVEKTPILTPPRARARLVQTAALAIQPADIPARLAALARPSRAADLLDQIAAGVTDAKAALKAAGANKAHLDKLTAAGHVRMEDDQLALALAPDDLRQALYALRKLDAPLRILSALARESEPIDVTWVYAQTDTDLNDLKRLEAAGLVTLAERQSWRDSVRDKGYTPDSALRLTPEQEAVWAALRAAIVARAQTPGAAVPLPDADFPAEVTADTPPLLDSAAWAFLLHGVTGSGKTELYLRAIELTLALGRQAIFLVPEIALTPQTVQRVASRFPGRTMVAHSGIGEGERYDSWVKARDGLAAVAVGARSALFTPFPNVGLIILDEEHDHSYKQSPSFQQPYYHARRTAEMLARQRGAVLILGSATPDVETTYRAGRGELTRLHLPTRITAGANGAVAPAELPPIAVVDMRDELRQGNTSMFSGALQAALKETLLRGEQAILFLNRRGQNTYVFCRDCGYVAACPRCDTPLTSHRDGMLRCHRCGHLQPEPTICPTCKSGRIKFFGAGTQQVEDALRELLPNARAIRWDADTASAQGAHEALMGQFAAHQADVLIGTQMIAKGLDLPTVTLVGIVSADSGLSMPDFRANERAFQLLTQVAGRAGRGQRGGRAILQTYQPTHYAVTTASRHDYDAFYAREIAYRREMGYPPFRRLARLLVRLPDANKAKHEAERAATLLRKRISELNMSGTTLIGPAPCFYGKENNVYRWHVLLRGPDPTPALRDLDLPKGWSIDIDPVDIL